MCSPEEMPHDVVTMNSRVKFRNLSDGEVRVRTLVYPAKMTDSNTQLSVMAPVGAALLGLRVGDSIHWELPGGVATHLEVLNSNTSQKLLATTCFNPICTSDNSLCPEDALASSFRSNINQIYHFALKRSILI